MIYRTAAQSWALGNGFGSHRIIVNVPRPTTYAMAKVMLRRRDLRPDLVGMRVVHSVTGNEVKNVSILHIDREKCSVLFEASSGGEYAIYYMPFLITAKECFFPTVNYMNPEEMTPDPGWLASCRDNTLLAEVVAVESRTSFDSFYPMEVPMTRPETEAFLSPYRSQPFMLVAEHRSRPIMMLREFPEIWADRSSLALLSDKAAANEYYAFQIAVYAFEDLDDIKIVFEDGNGNQLGSDICTAINACGTDYKGKSFINTPSVRRGELLPFWCGIDVEKAPVNERLEIRALITACGVTQIVNITLDISREMLPNKGDDEIRRLSRIRWLNSCIGLDSESAADYEPVSLEGLTVAVLGRSVLFGQNGLPCEITSCFSQDCSYISETAHPVLAAPVTLRIEKAGDACRIEPTGAAAEQIGSGCVRISGGMLCEDLSIHTETVMEYDGHLDTVITITALTDTAVNDISLILPYEKSAAVYMMGMGKEGGFRSANWQYRWRADRANNCLWMGSTNAGLHIKLKHTQDVWEIFSYEKTGLPESWYNEGRGGACVRELHDCVEFRAYSGPRLLKSGQSVIFRYSLIVTPLKPIDYGEHWNTRYHHIGTWEKPAPDVAEAARVGARAIILHQGSPLIPYINYPFDSADKLREQINQAHMAGIKYKLYYTVRELSNHASELPVLRCLQDKVLREGPVVSMADGFLPARHTYMTGGPWLLEHLVEGFVPAWQTLLDNGEYDCALAMTGLSRWHNYYLEGLSWLCRELGVDGLYLDGVGYDRQIMKRVRKVLDRAKPGCLIDLHCFNTYDPIYGLGSPVCNYMELLPSIDSLWVGESFDYEAKPADYWLVEVSGIPFGIMGEMLQGGGNKWRGMVFGMSCRYGWNQEGDPTPVWNFWDEYGLKDSRMFGFWNPECPVSTGSSSVKATAYVTDRHVIVAVASWEGEPLDEGGVEWVSPRSVLIGIDTKVLNLPEDYVMVCPAICDFQEESRHYAGELIQIIPARGRIFVINRPDREKHIASE